ALSSCLPRRRTGSRQPRREQILGPLTLPLIVCARAGLEPRSNEAVIAANTKAPRHRRVRFAGGDICRKDQLTYGPEPRRTFVHSITRIELKWIGVGNAVNDRHALRKKSPSGESIFLQCFG